MSLAVALGLCIVYVAQLFRRQAQLNYVRDRCQVQHQKIQGSQGEDRVLMTWNGKFLPHYRTNQVSGRLVAGEPATGAGTIPGGQADRL